MRGFHDRPVWAEVDMYHLAQNLSTIRRRVEPGTGIMAVVKANAYGHGAMPVARFLVREGVGHLAVAFAAEGTQLREGGITAPILVMGPNERAEAEELVTYDLTTSIDDLEMARALQAAALRLGRVAAVHLRVDLSGAGIGLPPESALRALRWLVEANGLRVDGVFTHLIHAYGGASAEAEAERDRFDRLLQSLREAGLTVPVCHAASSPAIIALPAASNYDLVRPGLMLYGLPPLPDHPEVDLKPVMSLKARLHAVDSRPAGAQTGYPHRSETLAESLRIGTVPLGYADGLFLFFLEKGEVLVRGRRVPFLGRAMMDRLLIDLTGVPEAQPGDEVVLIGEQGGERITPVEVAERAGIGALNTECLTLLSDRVPRFYHYPEEGGKGGAQSGEAGPENPSAAPDPTVWVIRAESGSR